jgi:hypothetical protein
MLFVFALLQCIAPFVHAHVDGQTDASLHGYNIPHHLSDRSISQSRVETHESQAIVISDEYQRDDALAVVADSITPILPETRCTTLRTIVAFNAPYAPSDVYLTPQPHAPPRMN